MSRNLDRPHILHLVRWYPHEDDPMFGLFIQRHIRATKHHVRSTVVFVRPVKGLGQTVRTDAVVDGVREIRVGYPERKLRAANFSVFMSHVWSVVREVRRNDPFVLVHVHVLTRLGVIAWWLHRMRAMPYVITEHWSRYIDDMRYRGRLRKWWTRKVTADAGALVNVSKYLQGAMVGQGLIAKRMEVIPNVVDCDVFGIRPTEGYFVHVSCFQREAKNVLGLVRAMSEAVARGLEFQLKMVGVGEMREECMALAERLGVEGHVRFPGLLQGRDLADCVAGAEAMVVYSDYENSPVVVLEALAAGVPVISTRVGGVAEVVDGTNGILLAPRDTEGLIVAMRRISRGEVRFDRQTIRDRACRKFGVEAVADLHWEIYAQFLGAK